MKRQANYDDLLYTCYSHFGVLDNLIEYKDVGGFDSWLKLDSMTPIELNQELCTSGYREQSFEQKSFLEMFEGFSAGQKVVIPLHRFISRDLLSGLFLQTPFLFIEGLGILIKALNIGNVTLLYDPEEQDVMELLLACSKQISTDQLSAHWDESLISWVESSAHQRLFTSWEVEKTFEASLCISPLSILAIPWITRFGAGAFLQRFMSKKSNPVLLSLLGEVNKPGLYETTSDIMMHEFLEMRGGGFNTEKADYAFFLNQGFGRPIGLEKIYNLNFNADLWTKYGFRFGPGHIECVSRGEDLLHTFVGHMSLFVFNRTFKEQAEYLSLKTLLSFFKEHRSRPKIDSDQFEVARELALIVKPLVTLKRLSACYLMGECIENVVEHFVDDILPEVES
jgi:hypothetical protein